MSPRLVIPIIFCAFVALFGVALALPHTINAVAGENTDAHVPTFSALMKGLGIFGNHELEDLTSEQLEGIKSLQSELNSRDAQDDTWMLGDFATEPSSTDQLNNISSGDFGMGAETELDPTMGSGLSDLSVDQP